MTHTAIGYDSPADAMKAPRESIIYVASLNEGTGVERPDFLAVIDVDPSCKSYSQIIHRTENAQRRRRAAPLRMVDLQPGMSR